MNAVKCDKCGHVAEVGMGLEWPRDMYAWTIGRPGPGFLNWEPEKEGHHLCKQCVDDVLTFIDPERFPPQETT